MNRVDEHDEVYEDMPKFTIAVPHQLSESEALDRVKGLLEDLKREHEGTFSDLTEEWSGDSGRFSVKAMGMSVKGGLQVASREVTLNGDLPFAATPFKGRIEQMVRSRMEKLLA